MPSTGNKKGIIARRASPWVHESRRQLRARTPAPGTRSCSHFCNRKKNTLPLAFYCQNGAPLLEKVRGGRPSSAVLICLLTDAFWFPHRRCVAQREPHNWMANASDRHAESYSIFVLLNSMPAQCAHSAPEKHASFREEFLMFPSSLTQHAISSLFIRE